MPGLKVWVEPRRGAFEESDGTVPAGNGSAVGYAPDLSGNGNHLAQSTQDNKPVLRTGSGAWWLEADGVSDYMLATFTLSAPYWRYSVFRPLSWTDGHRLFCGAADASGTLMQTGTEPTMGARSGTTVPIGSALVGQDIDCLELYAGAGSAFRLGDQGVVTGNPGTSLPGGLSLFAFRTGTVPFNGRLYLVAMGEGNPTAAQWAAIAAYGRALKGSPASGDFSTEFSQEFV